MYILIWRTFTLHFSLRFVVSGKLFQLKSKREINFREEKVTGFYICLIWIEENSFSMVFSPI